MEITMKVTIKIDDKDLEKLNLKDYRSNSTKEDQECFSEYARFFDDGCVGWTNDSEYNLMFLKAKEQIANELLRANGYLFLNDVYDMLGIPRSKAGQIVGWIYDEKNPIGDDYVSFGIYKQSDFVNGYSKTIILDFNVDGNILNRIES